MGEVVGALIGTEGQRKTFQERLTRIERGGENTTRHLYIGPVDVAPRGGGKARWKTRRAVLRRMPGHRSFLGELVMVPLALAAGGAAVVAARAAGFHLLAEQPLYAANVWYGDLVLAGLVAFVLRAAFRLSGGMRGKAFLAGFMVMLFFQALFVVRAPEVFSTIYSDVYVSDILAKIGPA